MSAFEALGVVPNIIKAIEEMDWLLPTDVQDEAIPLILGGGDVMVAAETGSGKTGAFGIPMLQIIHESLRGEADVSETKGDSKTGILSVRMDPRSRDQIAAISSDGLTVQSRHEKAWGGCRANCGYFRGRVYFEATVTDEGLCRVGWAAPNASFEIGADDLSFGYGGTGKKSHSKSFDDYGQAYGLNDVIGCWLDLENGVISYSKNGKDLGQAFKIPAKLRGQPIFPAVVLKNAEMKFNFGQQPFKFPLRLGYVACTSAPWADTSFAKPATQASATAPLGLIVEPTRELAKQVYDEFTKFQKYLSDPPISHQLFTGGERDSKEMVQSLKAGVHIIIATPGRLMDLVKSGKLDLSNIKVLILDEADALLEQGHQSDMLTIYQKLPKQRGMQVVVCSATLHSPQIAELSSKICVNPTWVDLKGKDAVPETVNHAVIMIDPVIDSSWSKADARFRTDGVHAGDRVQVGLRTAECLSEASKRLKYLALLKLIEAFRMEQCIIFCRTQLDCDNLEEFLVKVGGGSKFEGKTETGKENPFSCTVLHGGRRQQERTANLQSFKEGDVRFLICTDVAARGLDIKELPYVINMTLPDKSETYIHRIGRVGRADCPGLALSIVSVFKEKQWFHTCNSRDRGRSCTRTQTTDQGGCTIWFDEAGMLEECEKRIQSKIERLNPAELLKGREKVVEMQQKLIKKATPESEESAKHVAVILPVAQQLHKLEVQAQSAFISSTFDPSRIKNLFGTPAKK